MPKRKEAGAHAPTGLPSRALGMQGTELEPFHVLATAGTVGASASLDHQEGAAITASLRINERSLRCAWCAEEGT